MEKKKNDGPSTSKTGQSQLENKTTTDAASNERKNPDEEDKNDSSSSWSFSDGDDENDSDPEIMLKKLTDLTSPYFNAEIFLTVGDTNNLPVPTSKLPKYKSLVDFNKKVPDVSKLPKRHRDKASPVKIGGDSAGPSTSTSSQQPFTKEPFYPIPGRKFLPHQLPVFRPRVEKPNVLTLMDSTKGPLSALNKCRNSNSKIKVWVKNQFGVKGYWCGKVVAFDKHWNLVLTDAEHIFQRKRHIKQPALTSTSAKDAKEEVESARSGKFLSQYSSHQKSEQKKQMKPESRSRPSLSSKEKTDIPKIQSGLKTLRLAHDFDGGTLQTLRQGLRSFLPNAPELEQIKSLAVDASCSKSELRKKRFVILTQAKVDFHGHSIVAQSQKYEIVHCLFQQIFVMGDEIIFIETKP